MSELAQKLDAMAPQFDKVLEEVRRSKQVDPEDLAAIERHKARLQELDDENPDAVVPEPQPEPEPAPEPSPEPSPEPTEPA
ncbi:hypothetical protein [Nocardia aurea]|uniref:hypothetical protein n=1 Tax=Nocardia aurea TaxID=2144174 RepID=UPI0033A8BACC